jgi:hypothetical protein
MTRGYAAGGTTGSNVDTIDYFDFSSNTTATDHGNLSVARSGAAGQSHITKGFSSGGTTGSNSDVIDEFNYASNTTATDHGNLSVARAYSAGTQY